MKSLFGIKNSGVSCFFNTAIQALFHSQVFVSFIRELPVRQEDVDLFTQQSLSLTPAVVLQLQCLQCIDSNFKVFDFTYIANIIGIQLTKQDDANQAFLYILEVFESYCQQLDAQNNSEYSKLYYRSFINSIKCVKCCATCKARKETDQVLTSLYLQQQEDFFVALAQFLFPQCAANQLCQYCSQSRHTEADVFKAYAKLLVLTVSKGKFNMKLPVFLDVFALQSISNLLAEQQFDDIVDYLKCTLMPWYFRPRNQVVDSLIESNTELSSYLHTHYVHNKFDIINGQQVSEPACYLLSRPQMLKDQSYSALLQLSSMITQKGTQNAGHYYVSILQNKRGRCWYYTVDDAKVEHQPDFCSAYVEDQCANKNQQGYMYFYESFSCACQLVPSRYSAPKLLYDVQFARNDAADPQFPLLDARGQLVLSERHTLQSEGVASFISRCYSERCFDVYVLRGRAFEGRAFVCDNAFAGRLGELLQDVCCQQQSVCLFVDCTQRLKCTHFYVRIGSVEAAGAVGGASSAGNSGSPGSAGAIVATASVAANAATEAPENAGNTQSGGFAQPGIGAGAGAQGGVRCTTMRYARPNLARISDYFQFFYQDEQHLACDNGTLSCQIAHLKLLYCDAHATPLENVEEQLLRLFCFHGDLQACGLGGYQNDQQRVSVRTAGTIYYEVLENPLPPAALRHGYAADIARHSRIARARDDARLCATVNVFYGAELLTAKYRPLLCVSVAEFKADLRKHYLLEETDEITFVNCRLEESVVKFAERQPLRDAATLMAFYQQMNVAVIQRPAGEDYISFAYINQFAEFRHAAALRVRARGCCTIGALVDASVLRYFSDISTAAFFVTLSVDKLYIKYQVDRRADISGYCQVENLSIVAVPHAQQCIDYFAPLLCGCNDKAMLVRLFVVRNGERIRAGLAVYAKQLTVQQLRDYVREAYQIEVAEFGMYIGGKFQAIDSCCFNLIDQVIYAIARSESRILEYRELQREEG